MSEHKILFIDDEPNVFSGMRRALRNEVDIHTAAGGSEALTPEKTTAPFSVIVSDCRIP